MRCGAIASARRPRRPRTPSPSTLRATPTSSATSGELDAPGTKLVSAGETDAFLVELDPDGKLVFAQRWGDSPAGAPNTVVVAADGTIALGGDFDGTIDFGGGPLVTAGLADVFVATSTATRSTS
ncbi:MAG: hypothetical protein IPJ34_42405 [Myxococcales bacterium]|nr:hypothetical protein [Myxococcales bacterium]